MSILQLSDPGHAAVENPNSIWALRKSFYRALWSKRTVPAVTLARQPAPLPNAGIFVELGAFELI
jgi:hypothetical protein